MFEDRACGPDTLARQPGRFLSHPSGSAEESRNSRVNFARSHGKRFVKQFGAFVIQE